MHMLHILTGKTCNDDDDDDDDEQLSLIMLLMVAEVIKAKFS